MEEEIDLEILKKHSLLFVDDEETLNILMSKNLSRYFSKYVSVFSGEEAWELLLREEFDVVITDIKMPGMSGLDLARKIREKKSDTVLFVSSAYSQIDFMLEAIDLKIDGYFLKPACISEMLKTIKERVELLEIKRDYQKTTKRFEVITQSMGEGLITVDEDGKINFCNSYFIKMLDREMEDILNQDVYEVLKEFGFEDYRRESCDILLTLKDKISRKSFQKVVKQSGDDLYLKLKISPIDKHDDENFGDVVVITDITEYKHYEDALFESRAHYKAVVDDTPFLICRFKEGGIIEFVNREYSNYFGFSPRELVGKSFFELIPESALEITKQIIKSLSKKNPIVTNEHKAIDRDGDIRWQRWTDRAIFNNQDEIVSYQSIGEDITERKAIEDKLKLANTIVQNSHTLLFIWSNKEGRPIEYVSENISQFGYNSEELISKSFKYSDMVFTEDLAQLNKEAKEYIKNHIDRFKQKYRIITKEGNLRWVEDNSLIKRDEKGDIFHIQGVVSDVTERINDQENLKIKDKQLLVQSRLAAMGELIGMIAHQWRQPISAISMGINNLKADIELGSYSEKRANEKYDEILFLVDFLSKTIDDFRDFFKEDKEKSKISVQQLVDETIKIMGKSLENSGVKLEKEIDERCEPEVFKREMLQVLLNIIKNSKDAIKEKSVKKGRILIRSFIEADGVVVIEICDNGGGIDETILPQIFDPYFSTKSASFGTGLGLYMSKTIIEQHHGGCLEARNTKDGVCFKISFCLEKI